MQYIKLGISVLFVLILSFLKAQKTAVYTDNNALYKSAIELFDKDKYSAAQKKFNEIISQSENPNDEIRVNAEYYKALCALKLFNKDAVYFFNDFVKKHPDSKWLESAYFQLGNYYYRKKSYPEVIDYFAKVNEFKLTEDELVEYKFKLGYSYMKNGDTTQALPRFYDIIDKQSEYYAPANYYYAHLNYAAGKYQVALTGFERIKSEKGFSDIIPYYLAQIYFLQNRYDDLLAYAIPMLENAQPEKSGEIARLIGESYYNKQDYAQALPYLEAYSVQVSDKTLGDYYQLAYTYYRNGNYEKAIKQFSPVASDSSKMGQIAQYHVADCYLKLENKTAARNAFQAASKLTFDDKVREDALFNYAKLAYELSYNPYHEAIYAFKEYLQAYPDNERSDEANEFLFYVFLNTRNYIAGLEALDLIKNKDYRLQQAYQYIAFNRAVELMLAKKNDEAYETFQKVQVYPIDKKIAAEAYYWQAEIKYLEGKYSQALSAYYSFQRSSGAYSTGLYDVTNYNIGYCHFKLEQFPEAAMSFRKYASKPSASDNKRLNDGYLRIGDCYFVARQYDLAVDFYDKATAIGLVDADYGYYQSAMAKGYMNRDLDKINALLALKQRYPDSKYVIDATYELGEAYFRSNDNEKALNALTTLSFQYPGSPYARKAMLLTGLIQYRQKKYDEALATFKKIAAEYPSYDDAKEAIARAEDIYVELGRVDEYNDWVQNIKYYNVSTTALDSVNYRSAENVYAGGNTEKSKAAFKNYLSKFPEGAFSLNAHFYLAESFYKEKDFANALENYAVVINRPTNKFSEPALVAASFVNYTNKNYQQALENYKRLEQVAEFKTNILEAQIGQMRCYNKMGNPVEVLQFADKVLSDQNTPQKIKLEAQILRAQALLGNGDLDGAKKAFVEVATSTKTIEGAEARYYIAYIFYTKAEYNKAEEEILEMTNQKPIYDNWLAKGFVLLADVYVKTGDLFQAKATLQSVIDNHDGAELVDEAKLKLAQIIELENPSNKPKAAPSEIKLDGYDAKYDKLYDENGKEKPAPSKEETPKSTQPETPKNEN